MVYYEYMDTFQALAEVRRREILELLASHKQLTAAQISEQFNVSFPAISQHLKVLREANLVFMQKNGQQRIYTLNPDAMLELQKWSNNLLKNWDEKFSRLDKLLKQEQSKLIKKG